MKHRVVIPVNSVTMYVTSTNKRFKPGEYLIEDEATLESLRRSGIKGLRIQALGEDAPPGPAAEETDLPEPAAEEAEVTPPEPPKADAETEAAKPRAAEPFVANTAPVATPPAAVTPKRGFFARRGAPPSSEA